MAGWECVDSTTVLGENDLQDVMSAVAKLTARWKFLGTSLGISASNLDSIQSATPHSLDDCLREMLLHWLRQIYDVEIFGKPTWRRLMEAVKDHVGGKNPALAQTIARDHPGTQDKKYRKHESQQQSIPCPQRGQESADSADAFSLPENISVMVSNYQLVQTIFAISDSECHSQETKTSEQFSPTVTIVDTATQLPLDCVLLLHGEKPPEVSCRTLFCYIAVQVSHHDVLGFHTYPLYHMESKPCKQGKLPLIFCFHKPGTVCVIQLSIHSIADSEGVDYMHQSENCTCVVQIIDRKQHKCYPRAQHGVVRVKEPPLIRYTGPLASNQYHKLERQFTNLFLSPNYEQIQQLSKQILESNISVDIKVFALCWEALSESVPKNYEHAEELLRTAWEKASHLECKNGLLLQARVLKHLAYMQYAQGNDNKALEYMSGAKERLFLAAPSNETAFALHTELLVRSRRLFSIPNCTFTSQMQLYEKEYELLLENAKYMEEYEQPVICSFLAVKASFHLRSDLITDQLPPKEYWPGPNDLRKAEECLESVSLDTMPNKINFYAARYYHTLCDLHVWKRQYPKAMLYLEEARKLYAQTKLLRDSVNQRHKLLERLTEGDKIDEILKEHSATL